MSKQGAERFGLYLSEFLARSTRFPNASAFAAAAGVSPSAVSRWVRGKERPAADALPKIAPLMGVSATQLFAIAYPEQAGEADTEPIAPPPPTFEEYLASLGLDEEQVQIIKSVHDQFVAANRARPTSKRRASPRSDDERRAI